MVTSSVGPRHTKNGCGLVSNLVVLSLLIFDQHKIPEMFCLIDLV